MSFFLDRSGRAPPLSSTVLKGISALGVSRAACVVAGPNHVRGEAVPSLDTFDEGRASGTAPVRRMTVLVAACTPLALRRG